MSKLKEKKIRKLRKKSIWPSILGLLFLLCVFSLIILISMASSCLDIVQRKLNEGSDQAARIAKLYEEYDEESAKDVQDAVLAYMALSKEVESVGIIDEAGKKIWSSDGHYPNIENISQIDLQQDNSGANVHVILEEDENQIFSVDENEITINDDFLKGFNPLSLFNFDYIFSDGENNSVLNFKIWFGMPANGLNVFVLDNIHIYTHDMFMLAVSLGLIILIITVFTLYYIISFIGFIISMRKNTKMFYTDMITGGENWMYFVKKGTSLLKRNYGNKRKYAMVHLRMLKYRSFCTCFGVREGEELIEKFYYALKKVIRSNELMAYHENAEFGVLISYGNEQQLLQRIEGMKHTLASVLPNMRLYFGVGVCEINSGEKDVEQLYNNALIACDMLGEENENKIAYYDIEMNKQKLWEHKVEDDMERALLNREFKVYLQPKISASQETLAGAEALVRWIHPQEGFIPPNKFIPIFERNGFILKLDDYMLEEVSRLQAQWLSEGRKIVPISVNVSRAHFTREDLAEHIRDIVDKYNVPHNVIELELTESAFFDDKKVLLNTVKKLRDFGFIVSMDDFGAGYSSLNSLKELQLDVLKIDADFFRGENVQERGMLIVSEVIDLAKKLNMKIVAEGIESREQVDFLVEQECDLIQGYFFAKPMAVEEFVEKYR